MKSDKEVLVTLQYSENITCTYYTDNTFEEFKHILAQLEKGLGREALNNMHIQVSGIEFGEKGEKRHLNFKDSKFNYKDLLKTWKEFKIKGVAVTESPNIEKVKKEKDSG